VSSIIGYNSQDIEYLKEHIGPNPPNPPNPPVPPTPTNGPIEGVDKILIKNSDGHLIHGYDVCKITPNIFNMTILIREPLFITPPTRNRGAVITVDIYYFSGARYRYKYWMYSTGKEYGNLCIGYEGKRVYCNRARRKADNVMYWTLGGSGVFGTGEATVIISEVYYLNGFADNTQWEIITTPTMQDADWENYDDHVMTMTGFYENTYKIGTVFILAKDETPPTDEQRYPFFIGMKWVKDTVMSTSTTMDFNIRQAPTSTEDPEYGIPTKEESEAEYEAAQENADLPPIINA
jgi:hypothetical protein